MCIRDSLCTIYPIDTDQHIADIAGDADGFENQRISLDFLVCCTVSYTHLDVYKRQAPEVKDLTRTEMTELMEYIFSLFAWLV